MREFHTWDKVRADLEEGEVLRRNRHYEVLFSPYVRKHAYPCLVTTRNRTESPENKWFDKRARNWAVELASAFPLTPHIINLIVDLKPEPRRRSCSRTRCRALIKDEYDEVSYKVLNIGAANLLPAYSAEIGVPMDGRHIEAVERIIAVAAEHRRLGEVYQSSPISFRFVKASPAYLSMMHGRDTMMIELIQLSRTRRRLRAAGRLRGGAVRARRPPALGPGQHADRQPRARRARCTRATATGWRCAASWTRMASRRAVHQARRHLRRPLPALIASRQRRPLRRVARPGGLMPA